MAHGVCGPQTIGDEAGDARLRQRREEVKEWVHISLILFFSFWLVGGQNNSNQWQRPMICQPAQRRLEAGQRVEEEKERTAVECLLGFEINLNTTRYEFDPTQFIN